jgi:hypothetical protein
LKNPATRRVYKKPAVMGKTSIQYRTLFTFWYASC